MSLKVSHPIRECGNSVPYPPLADDIRRNHGFIDLRGHPDLATSIPETEGSPALRLILQDLAYSRSSIMTVGCDLGEHLERGGPLKWRRIAGGYIQVALLPLGPTDNKDLLQLSRTAQVQLGRDVGTHRWEVKFELSRTNFTFEKLIETHTVWIWFFAAASTAERARIAREDLLTSLRIGLREASQVVPNKPLQ